MKKKLLIILLFVGQFGFAQNAYYDALFISKMSDKGLQQILDANIKGFIHLSEQEKKQVEYAQYFINDPFDNTNITSVISFESVRSATTKYNSFVQNEYGTGGYNAFGLGAAPSALGLIGSAISGDFSISADDQTKILDGITKYYAEEFKKAQLLTYMQTLENTIGKVGELQVLFPTTYEKLLKTNPSKFPELGDEYKEIFSEDLKKLINNLADHIENHASGTKIGAYDTQIDVKDKNNKVITTYYVRGNEGKGFDNKLVFLDGEKTIKIKADPNFRIFKMSEDIGSKLINNYHPVDLFNYLDANYYDNSYLTTASTLDKKLGVVIHGINLVQKNLLDTAKSKTSQFSNLWLTFEQFNKINTVKEWGYFAGLLYQQDKAFFEDVFFKRPTTKKLTDVQIKQIKNLYNKVLSSLHQIQQYRGGLDAESLKENYIEYMKIIIEVFRQANYKNHDLSKFFKISNYSLQIYDNARSKDYSNSIHYLTLILDEFLGANTKYLETMQKIDEYGTFMTDVVNSEDSDEVKEVIKKHVAPPASFILKREYANTFSITGQPGYFISAEYLDVEEKWGFVSGVTLPIGFEFTFKGKKGTENSSSIGIFAQLIDLGAMLNFRVSDSTSNLPDKVEFRQIFSPGGSITYGFKNSPVTLGLGYQYTPELREVTFENGNKTFPNGHRVFLRLAWDIPFINIWRSKGR
ncbi:MAG: hypothetical protein RIF33_20195 [Cyclobacteriaceae bacterium]